MTDTERRRLRFWVFPWIGAWLGIGGGVTSRLWTAHPTIGWIVGASAGYFAGVSIIFSWSDGGESTLIRLKATELHNLHSVQRHISKSRRELLVCGPIPQCDENPLPY